MSITVAPVSTNGLVQLAPSLAESYQAFCATVLDGGTLSPEARAAAALAAAIAFNRSDVVRSFLAAAKQAGLSNEDVGQVAAIVDVLRIESHHQVSGGAVQSERVHVHEHKKSKSCC